MYFYVVELFTIYCRKSRYRPHATEIQAYGVLDST